MAISGEKYPFTQGNVDKSPTSAGIYTLYDENVTIYIGKGDGENGIRARLQAHKKGDEGSFTKKASHYRREVCSNPASREKELLQEYKQEHRYIAGVYSFIMSSSPPVTIESFSIISRLRSNKVLKLIASR